MSSVVDVRDTWPYAYGGPALQGKMRVFAEDFRVVELSDWVPEGQGEHVWLWIRKTNANTEWVARQLAKAAGVRPHDVGFAGMKDRHAVTEQWFTIWLPRDPEPDWSSLCIEGVEILKIQRGLKKLKRGALQGNQFQITIRDVTGHRAQYERTVDELLKHGVPNYFGEQRFGLNNLAEAERMLKGEYRVKDPHQRGLYLSVARSFLFNEVLAERVKLGNWHQIMQGEAVILAGSGSYFNAQADDMSLLDRLVSGDIHPSAPLYGEGASPATELALVLETDILSAYTEWQTGLIAARVAQARRATRLPIMHWQAQWLDAATLQLSFSLPAGCYATTVLREILS